MQLLECKRVVKAGPGVHARETSQLSVCKELQRGGKWQILQQDVVPASCADGGSLLSSVTGQVLWSFQHRVGQDSSYRHVMACITAWCRRSEGAQIGVTEIDGREGGEQSVGCMAEHLSRRDHICLLTYPYARAYQIQPNLASSAGVWPHHQGRAC